MELTDKQQKIMDGARGAFLAKCIRWLVDWGEAMGAERLIPVTNTHALVTVPGNLVYGASQKTIESAMELLRPACEHQVCCHSTTHITFAHEEQYDEIEMPEEQVSAQLEIQEMARDAGFLMTYTCAPYLVGNVPVKGEICAWTESSAVVYANSILGARTTRHGTESAIAAALVGFVPEFGVLLDENRRATLQIDVMAELCTPTDWGALGYFAGKEAGLEVPVFQGTPQPLQEDAKQLCAALATGGGVTMCHIAGVTPEAATLDQALGGEPPKRQVTFGEDELADAYRQLRNNTSDVIDTVILGCPHASLQEIAEIALYLKGKHIADGVKLWVCTAYATRANAERLGYAKMISDAGGYVFCDTCPTNSMRLEAERIATAGFKQAHYARNMIKAEVVVDHVKACLDTALTGRWSDAR
ncbi:aconitase X catalytic domain-containing protein [Candidatus Poribacteria bacterium]